MLQNPLKQRGLCILIVALLFLLGRSPLLAQQPKKQSKAPLQASTVPPGLEKVGGLMVSPIIIVHNLTMDPKDNKTDIKLDNINTAVDMRVDCKIQPFLPAEDGWKYNIVKGHDHDAAPWLSLAKSSLEIPKGSTKYLQLIYKIPPTAKGYYWAVLLLEVQTSNTPGQAGNIVAKTKANCYLPIFISTRSPRKATLEISSLELTSVQAGNKPTANLAAAYALSAIFVNNTEGFSQIGVDTIVKEATSQRIVYQRKMDNARFILPRSRRRISTYVPSLPDGKYIATFHIYQDTNWLKPLTIDFIVASKKLVVGGKPGDFKIAPVVLQPETWHVPNAKPASIVTKQVEVRNNSDRPLTLQIVPTGIKQYPTGYYETDPTISPDGLNITVSPKLVVLQPGKTQTVQMRVEVKRQTKGDKWFGLRVQESEGASDPVSLIANMVVGDQSAPELELLGDNLDMVNGVPKTFHFRLRNLGNLAVVPVITAFVQNTSGTEIRKTEVVVPDWNGIGVLPGATLDNQIEIPSNLKPGDYTVRIDAMFNNSGPTLLKNFTIKKVAPGKANISPTKDGISASKNTNAANR